MMVKEVYVNAQKKEIPEKWTVKIIGEVCKYKAGSTFPKNEQGNEKGDIPFYKVSDMNKFEKYMEEANNYISKEKADELNVKICPSGTVIFPKLGQALLTNKRRVLSTVSAFDNNVAGLISNQINKEFLYYFLLSLKFDTFSNPGTVPSLTKKAINSIDIIYPPLPEQKKIASILSSVDKSIEKTDEVIEETKELKKGLMQELLTKGIGHTEFKEVRLGVKTYTVPVNWKVTTIEEITNGKPRYGANSSAKDFNPNLPRYVRITDLSEDGFLKNGDKKSIPMNEADSYYLEKGDIVFARSGATVGKTYIYDPKDGLCAYAGYLIRFKINTEKVIPKYLLNVTHSYYYSAWVKSMIRATSQPNINSKEYASFDLLLPPLEEQKKIASILSSVDAKIKKEEEYKAKLERLKKGLMQKLLTGEIRVNTEMEV